MVSPVYCNEVEINTIYTATDGDLVELRFFYQHPPMPEGLQVQTSFPIFPLTFGPVVIMPRQMAKDMLKRFLTFMAQQDEAKPKDNFCPECKEKYHYFPEDGKLMKSCKCGTKEDTNVPKL